MQVLFYLQIISGLTDAQRERERERERERGESRESELDRAPPQTCRRDRPAEIISAVVLVAHQRCRYRSSSRCSLVPSLLISFSLLIYRSCSRSRPKAHRHRRSRRLDLVVVSLSLKFSITLSSSLS